MAEMATSERLVAPEDCADMAQVRAGVDRLDHAIVRLLAERQRYMTAAARVKTVRANVHDAARIKAVIANVKAISRREGLSEAIAGPVWRLLIDRCIAHELAEWDRLHPEPLQ
jgi:isochorismate pyruvate lyase